MLFVRQVSTRSFVPYPVWVISGLERAGPSEPVNAVWQAGLFAARGEFEPFQILMRAPARGLNQVRVTASDLVGQDDRKIDSSNIHLYFEHSVDVSQASPDWQGPNRPLGAGRYPDALIPLDSSGKPFAVPPAADQPVWVDVFVPHDARPGDYEGAIHVIASEGTVEVPLKLTVWNFTLPRTPALKTSFGYWAATREGIEELLRHKIMPQRVSPALCAGQDCSGLANAERDLMSRYGLSMTDVGFWSGADRNSCAMPPPPEPVHINAAAAAHASGLYLYSYTADEVQKCRSLHEAIRAWGRNLRLAGVKHLVVMEPIEELLDDNSGQGASAADIWVVLPKTFEANAEIIRRAIQKGNEVWSYNALSQDPYSPKWLIDYDLINYRIQPGFLSQSLGLTGLLYWRIDRWSADPWKQVDNVGEFAPGGNYPGEGMLGYPGQPRGLPGIVPSIRLKQIREGVEDYEYFEQLKALGRGEWALSIARGVAPGWRGWTRERVLVENARLNLGREIHRLRTGAGAPAQ